MKKYLNTLRRQAGVRSLLSALDSNPKVAKNGKLGVLTAVMHLAPGDMSGHEVCPKRSPGCSAACLHFAGSPAYMTGKTQARIKRTKLFFEDRNLFMNILALEIAEHVALAEKQNMEPAIRLNGTSDIVWEKKKFILWPETAAIVGFETNTIITLFPTLTFYDYTAIPRRNPGANYHLTFSMKEHNMNDVASEMSRGLNIAAVFPYKSVPPEFLGRPTIDGDEHDFRPADPEGVVVALKAKGVKGKHDLSGFVYRVTSLAENDNFPLPAYEASRVSATSP
jgi:hypothetical protein